MTDISFIPSWFFIYSLVLNLVFITILSIFVNQAGTGRIVNEQAYAKQVALMISEAKPRMTFLVDMSEALKIADANKMARENVVIIDETKRTVNVKLASSGGYSYGYITSGKVSAQLQNNFLVVKVEG